MMKIVLLAFIAIQLTDSQIDKSGLVPDIIDKYPQSILSVTYKGNVKVQEGNELKPVMVKDPPTVTWEANSNNFYLLSMVDPDSPSRANPTNREWIHWLVGNIPGDNLSKGEVLAEYIGSAPPPGMGLHRYTQLLYMQHDKIDFTCRVKLNNTSALGRQHFHSRCFAKKYNLGEPIAINMFLAQYDSSVPLVYQQIHYTLGQVMPRINTTIC